MRTINLDTNQETIFAKILDVKDMFPSYRDNTAVLNLIVGSTFYNAIIDGRELEIDKSDLLGRANLNKDILYIAVYIMEEHTLYIKPYTLNNLLDALLSITPDTYFIPNAEGIDLKEDGVPDIILDTVVSIKEHTPAKELPSSEESFDLFNTFN